MSRIFTGSLSTLVLLLALLAVTAAVCAGWSWDGGALC